jgi:hypothetical protein
MTTRPVFGDFAAAANQHLRRAAGPPGHRGTQDRADTSSADDVARSLRRLLPVMSRYAGDIAAATARQQSASRSQAGPWEHASRRASEALRHAAALLQPITAPPRSPGCAPQPDPVARRLDAATTELTAGRDVLHTHLASYPGGALRARTEWAPVLLSAPVTRALLSELGTWAHQIAPLGSQRAFARAPARGTPDARRRLSAACQQLWALDLAVQAADEQDPVPDQHLQLLHAIPASALTPRHLPEPTEPVTRLCQGTIDTAERVRRHAWAAVLRASWSPALTIESLRESAAHAIVTSHNCQILLTTLAVGPQPRQAADLSTPLAEAADAAGQARQAWLQAERAWHGLITDTRGTISRTAREAADLALWTGRLAYATPGWTPGAGPAHPPRPARDLAPRPADHRQVIAAVHHAQHTLTQLASTDHDQIRTASATGRLLLPVHTLPDSFDVPYLYGPAPAASTEPLLAAYRDAQAASAQAVARTATIAEAIGSRSQILTAARTATQPSASTPAVPEHRVPAARPRPAMNLPGPVEHILHDFGVTAPEALHRAAAIDRAADQLILQAAHDRSIRDPAAAPPDLSRSAHTAEIISHLLTTGNPRSAALLHPPEPRPSAQAEIEP